MERHDEDSGPLSGIKVVDDLTVSFELTAPDGSFPRALGMGWGFIRPASTPHKVTDTPPPFVGPYKISDYQLDKSVSIVREPTWDKNVSAGVPQEANENNKNSDSTILMSTSIHQHSPFFFCSFLATQHRRTSRHQSGRENICAAMTLL